MIRATSHLRRKIDANALPIRDAAQVDFHIHRGKLGPLLAGMGRRHQGRLQLQRVARLGRSVVVIQPLARIDAELRGHQEPLARGPFALEELFPLGLFAEAGFLGEPVDIRGGVVELAVNRHLHRGAARPVQRTWALLMTVKLMTSIKLVGPCPADPRLLFSASGVPGGLGLLVPVRPRLRIPQILSRLFPRVGEALVQRCPEGIDMAHALLVDLARLNNDLTVAKGALVNAVQPPPANARS